VLKIFIDNRFPVLLVAHKAAIRCLDLSSSKRKLAVVDEHSKVFVYDLMTKEVTFEDVRLCSICIINAFVVFCYLFISLN
jgi:intraflagellar transport protein 122